MTTTPMLIIDTNVHIYSDDDNRYPPIDTPTRPPGTSGSVTTLESLARESCVSKFCIVHPLSFYGWDCRFICDVSKAHSAHMAGVCSLDPDDEESPALLEEYVAHHAVRGLRSHTATDGRLDRPGVRALWSMAERLGIPVNVSIDRNERDDVFQMLETFHRTPVILDHCLVSEPGPELSSTFADVVRMARFPNVYAKLNFLPLGSEEEYPFRDMHDPCRRIIASYGPERCVWGNSFPCQVWSPQSTYAQNLHLFTHHLGLEDSAKEYILGKTAHGLWFNGAR